MLSGFTIPILYEECIFFYNNVSFFFLLVCRLPLIGYLNNSKYLPRQLLKYLTIIQHLFPRELFQSLPDAAIFHFICVIWAQEGNLELIVQIHDFKIIAMPQSKEYTVCFHLCLE